MSNIEKLSSSSSLKDLVDRQELLTNSIEAQKNTLKSILESKNVVVSEEENKLSILIDKVNELDDGKLWLYRDGNEYTDLTGGFDVLGHNLSYCTSQKTPYLKLTNKLSGGNWHAGFYNKIPINVTGYSKLKFNLMEYYAGSSPNDYAFYVTKDTSIAAKDYALVTGQTTGIIELDISNINGPVYLRFRPFCYGSYIVVDKIWLEK